MMRISRGALAVFCLIAGGCSKRSTPPPGPSGPPAKLEGDVVLAPGQAPARGRLVVAWRTAAEQKDSDEGKTGLKAIRDLTERWIVGEEVDFSKTPRVHYRITDEAAPADGTAVVLLDVDHTFWPTLMGGGKGLQGSSKVGLKGGEVVITRPPPRAPAKDGGGGTTTTEPCSGPRMKLVTIEESALSRGVNDSAAGRRFCAWLPKSWATAPETKKYPLIFMLPGFMSGEMAYLSGKNHAGDRLDALLAKNPKLPEPILIGVDTSTRLGSTYLEDSPTNGPWDTFLSKRALPELEKVLRGIPKRTARALIGQSTGGLNSLSYGMRHSDLFSAIGSSSPDAPDVELWLFEPGTRRPREWIRKWAQLESEVGGAGQTTSWALDWSPNKPSGHFIPFDVENGTVDEGVIRQWVAKTPHGMLKSNGPAFMEKMKKDLGGRVLIIVGKNDEFGLYPPAESFAKELNAAGVETKFVATEDGHGNGISRLEEATQFVLERLDRE